MSQKPKKARKGETVPADQPAKIDAYRAAHAAAVGAAVARLSKSEPIRGLAPLERLHECASNPRTVYDQTKLEELAASVREFGLLEPLLVRLRPGSSIGADEEFEIVCGHRRFRAAKLAGLDPVPVEVRELDDLAVLEIQLVENVQRADLSPIEEARAYRRAVDLGQKPEEIAERIGVSRSTLYERLRLLELPEKARQAVASGELSPSTAALLVRIGDPKAREKAAAEILAGELGAGDGRRGKTEPLSFRQARELVREEYLLELKGAPWKLDDAELVPAAGPCSSCPKRTGNMKEARDVIGELRPDVCTDGACFRAKSEAIWIKRSSEHAAAGGTILSEAAAKKVFGSGWGSRVVHGSSWVDLEEKPWAHEIGLNGGRTWRAILKKADVKTALARNKDGTIVELAPKAVAEKIARESMPKGKARKVAADPYRARQRAALKAAKVATSKRRKVLRGFHDWPVSSWGATTDRNVVRLLGRVLELETGSEATTEIARLETPKGLQGWEEQKKARKALQDRLASPSTTEAMKAALELALSTLLLRERHESGRKSKELVDELLGFAGLDRKKLEALDEPKAAPATKKPKAGAKPAAGEKSPAARIAALARKIETAAAKKKRKGARRAS